MEADEDASPSLSLLPPLSMDWSRLPAREGRRGTGSKNPRQPDPLLPNDSQQSQNSFLAAADVFRSDLMTGAAAGSVRRSDLCVSSGASTCISFAGPPGAAAAAVSFCTLGMITFSGASACCWDQFQIRSMRRPDEGAAGFAAGARAAAPARDWDATLEDD